MERACLHFCFCHDAGQFERFEQSFKDFRCLILYFKKVPEEKNPRLYFAVPMGQHLPVVRWKLLGRLMFFFWKGLILKRSWIERNHKNFAKEKIQKQNIVDDPGTVRPHLDLCLVVHGCFFACTKKC